MMDIFDDPAAINIVCVGDTMFLYVPEDKEVEYPEPGTVVRVPSGDFFVRNIPVGMKMVWCRGRDRETVLARAVIIQPPDGEHDWVYEIEWVYEMQPSLARRGPGVMNLMEEMCATCPWRPANSNDDFFIRSHRRSSLKGFYQTMLEDGTSQRCHEQGPQGGNGPICAGFAKNAVREILGS